MQLTIPQAYYMAYLVNVYKAHFGNENATYMKYCAAQKNV